jgi:hypothetical protein
MERRNEGGKKTGGGIDRSMYGEILDCYYTGGGGSEYPSIDLRRLINCTHLLPKCFERDGGGKKGPGIA